MKRYLLCYTMPIRDGHITGHAYMDLAGLTQAALEEAARAVENETRKDHPNLNVGALNWTSVVRLDE